MTANFLFWFQVVMAWVYTVPQVYAIATGNTKGLNLTLYVLFMAYLILSLSLAVSAYKAEADKKLKREKKLIVKVFLQWTFFIGLIFVAGLSKIVWQPGDTVVCTVITALLLITIGYYRGLSDEYSRGLMAVWCKAAPQLWLAYTMFNADSSEGLPLITLTAGHLTSVPRLIQVWLSGRKSGWDRPTQGLMIGESANVGTWTVVTIVWVLLRL